MSERIGFWKRAVGSAGLYQNFEPRRRFRFRCVDFAEKGTEAKWKFEVERDSKFDSLRIFFFCVFCVFSFACVTIRHEVGEELICGERRSCEEVEWKFEVDEKSKFELLRPFFLFSFCFLLVFVSICHEFGMIK